MQYAALQLPSSAQIPLSLNVFSLSEEEGRARAGRSADASAGDSLVGVEGWAGGEVELLS
eukprot:3865871-Rhodomonas_salina.2